MEWISFDIKPPEDLTTVDLYGYSVDLDDNHQWERVTDVFFVNGDLVGGDGKGMSAFNHTHWMLPPQPPN